MAAGLKYTVAFSADLLNWEPSAAVPVVAASDAGLDAVTVPYPSFITTGPAAGRRPQYFRVPVSMLP